MTSTDGGRGTTAQEGRRGATHHTSASVQLFDTTQLALKAALQGTSLRQTAIAQNIANVNTPGYRRQEVDFESALAGALAANDRTAVSRISPVQRTDAASPVRADGNSVDMDTEAAGQARNGLMYEAIVAVSKARTNIIQTAIGQPR